MNIGAVDLRNAVESGLFVGARIEMYSKSENNFYTLDVFHVEIVGDYVRFFISTMTRTLRSDGLKKRFAQENLRKLLATGVESISNHLSTPKCMGLVFELSLQTQIHEWHLGIRHYWFSTNTGASGTIYPYQ